MVTRKNHPYVIKDGSVEFIGKNFVCLVSLLDLELVEKYRWILSTNNTIYRNDKTGTKPKTVKLHREIAIRMGLSTSFEVDHINRNRLDNRRENLRSATRQQQLFNTSLRSDNTSGFKGVHYDKSRDLYIAKVSVNGKGMNLGRYKTPEEAYRVYSQKASELFGEFYAR